MEWICIAYLLLKSGLGIRFSKFDIVLADILEDVAGCPEAIYIIANLTAEVPERMAWNDFMFDLTNSWRVK